VDGVGKKFCRSLKKSLWYGVCDIAGELLPGRKRQRVASNELRVKGGAEEAVAGSELLVASGNASAGGGDRAAGASEPVTSYPPLATPAADLNSWDDDLREGEFYAVKDVSFELRRGECLGLIGHNGAGKTTLLKMLNGLIKPDRGTITMRGRVGALIALGAGFNPILTGRENIYINGSVLGLTKKEIDEKIDEIIDFAEIREFIDMPVQSYSSGMTVRLGFSVATAMNPDVLILDEVLAVGDQRFILKCFERIGKLLSNGVAGILISHQMQNIERTCNRFIVINKGKKIIDTNDLKQAINCYRMLEGEVKKDANIIHHPTSSIKVNQIIINSDEGIVAFMINSLNSAPKELMISYSLHFKGAELLKTTTMTDRQQLIPIIDNRIFIQIPDALLKLGPLTLNVSLWDSYNKMNLAWIQNIVVAANIAGHRLSVYS
jgi:ABC-type polysaccharide/polyol phosphate transport system ATPase subunit